MALPSRPAGWDPRIYAISPANVEFLSAIGIWQHLDTARMAPVYDMEIHGDAGGRLDFSAYDSGLRELAWIVESSLMQQELWETVKRQHNVTLVCPAAPAALAIDDHTARLTLADGRRIEARLVVAADGRDSWVRQAAGIGARNTPYDEKGVVANFRCEKPHRNTAFQWFRKDGVLAYLPLPEQHMSMVWSAPDALADELVALSPEALCAKVAEAGEHRLGNLTPVTPAANWSAPSPSSAVGSRKTGPAPQISPPAVGWLGDRKKLCTTSPMPDCEVPGLTSDWLMKGTMLRETRFQSSFRRIGSTG